MNFSTSDAGEAGLAEMPERIVPAAWRANRRPALPHRRWKNAPVLGGADGSRLAISLYAPPHQAAVAWPALAAILDELAYGIVTVDASRRLQFANRAGFAALRHDHALRLAGGVIEAIDPADAEALRRAVAAAGAGKRGYLALGRAARACDVAVLPIAGEPGMAGEGAVLLFEKSVSDIGLSLYFYGNAHRLTPAEQSVLDALGAGDSVGAVAHRLGSSEHTVRSHVRGILAKTGQPNLRRLAARIGTLPPVCTRQTWVTPAPAAPHPGSGDARLCAPA